MAGHGSRSVGELTRGGMPRVVTPIELIEEMES
jgi:hypothetical protein